MTEPSASSRAYRIGIDVGGTFTKAVLIDNASHEVVGRFSARLFAVTDTLASYKWDTVTVERHLRQLSAAMADEVEYLVNTGTPVLTDR